MGIPPVKALIERGRERGHVGATYQNDYLSLPFTLIDKSCYVNEWSGRDGRRGVNSRVILYIATLRGERERKREKIVRGERGKGVLVRIKRKLKILRLCGEDLKGTAHNGYTIMLVICRLWDRSS